MGQLSHFFCPPDLSDKEKKEENMSHGDYVPCLCCSVSAFWNILTAWSNPCAELLFLVLPCCSIISVNTWCEVCFHQWFSWFTPEADEEEEEKGTQVSNIQLMN